MHKRTILVWFRNDLRIHDNEILLRAVERSHQIVPVFCFDPRYFADTEYGTKKTGVLRAAFIRENVSALQHMLRQLGGELIIAHGYPEILIPQIAEKHQVDEVYHHREVAHEETAISALVEEALWKMQINLRHFIGHTLYHKEDLPFPIKDIPDAFTIFKKKTERESTIRPELGRPDTIRVPEGLDAGCLPDLSALGFSSTAIQHARKLRFPGGESVALQQMNAFLYGDPDVTDYSCLSPYIAIGALSPNTLYHAAKDAENTALDKKRVEQIILKLLWRDYYRFMFKKHGNRFFQVGGLTGTPPDSVDDDEQHFGRWKTGNTGNAIIDKTMYQLNETGYIPHDQRVIVAAYLVHELKVNWLKGAAWFEERLLDYGPASNYGSWAHLAGVGSSIKDNKPVDIKKLSTRLYPKEALAFGE
ncbi:deoxyribodipyrimidine photo-lyase [Parapedobacter pyrenivorans]|uniref:Cryptochrome DASH n=1 Tax=Parapedobacter pyrenivorans TaxID=1305674 RepID=A0A917MBY3_9SPHI|nr:DASH family cryptochrome [Parapedobacter pyrenivorans]GGG91479.1 deoxyribodipyrimidine photo-lyase [Parapedobacter pyrenivorans]